MKTSRALISVSDKRGVVEFAQKLSELGVEILSTGGTAKVLQENNIAVKNVSDYTGFPEIMDGRVKTLHPKIHGGLLARRDNQSHIDQAQNHNISFIDLVVTNLYPFKETLEKENVTEEEIIENIDIGGPSMIRSAAKNYENVIILTDPEDYFPTLEEIRKKGNLSLNRRKKLAQKAFSMTFDYDLAISKYFDSKLEDNELPQKQTIHAEKLYKLRYGENPHQKATFYRTTSPMTANIPDAKVLNGKELSFNNIIDASSALELVKEFKEPAVVFIKHNNPCGVAVSDRIEDAFIKSHQVDSMSAFGSIVALNRIVTSEIVDYITEQKIFLEIIIAPDFEETALKRLRTRQNLRILSIDKPFIPEPNAQDFKYVSGGLLVQDQDQYSLKEEDLQVVTKRKPTSQQINDLLLAEKIAKHVKSNAVVMVKNGIVTAIGAGQMSRLDSVRIANFKGQERNQDSVMASDAFFPFADAMELAIESGVTAFIQPGGSVNDQEVIKRADELDVAMIFSGYRHFRH